MDPILVMELLNRLSYTTQDLPPFLESKLRNLFDQGKKCASEIGIDENAFLLVGVDMHLEPSGACKLSGEALGEIIEGPRHALEDKRLIPGAG
jgi:hypothetical protein